VLEWLHLNNSIVLIAVPEPPEGKAERTGIVQGETGACWNTQQKSGAVPQL